MGEKFSEYFADKTDQMQTRLPAAQPLELHVEASRAASSPSSHHPGTGSISGVPPEVSQRAQPPQQPCHRSPCRTRARRALTRASKKMNIPSGTSFHTGTDRRQPVLRKAKSTAVIWVLAHTLSTLAAGSRGATSLGVHQHG